MSIKQLKLTGIMATTLVVAFSTTISPCKAAEQLLSPEIISTSWNENGNEMASVSVNGQEIITYKGATPQGTAEQRASNLSEKLLSILEKSRGRVDQLLPTRDGTGLSAIKVGNEIVKFDPPSEVGKMVTEEQALAVSLKVVNALRNSAGTEELPDSYSKYAEAIADGQPIPAGINKPTFTGSASWYGGKFHGRKTSNGERYNQDGMTAAHRTLAFGTKLLVTNRKTGKSCVVKVNDRGPYVGNRVIDLSRGAAKQLNMLSAGVGVVDVLVLGVQ